MTEEKTKQEKLIENTERYGDCCEVDYDLIFKDWKALRLENETLKKKLFQHQEAINNTNKLIDKIKENHKLALREQAKNIFKRIENTCFVDSTEIYKEGSKNINLIHKKDWKDVKKEFLEGKK